MATVLAAIAAAALIAIPAAIAAFGARIQDGGNVVSAAPDFTAPAIAATVVTKSQGGATGFVHKGGTYFAYANVAADTGNPPSGLATVKANLGEVTAGQGEATLTAITPVTIGGVTYNSRSAELTATAVVEGPRPYTVTATDKAGNARTVNGSATVDNVVPTAADVQTANGGTAVGLAEERDSIAYTFSEPIEPQSILAGWNGTATNVVVRIVDNGLLGLETGHDELLVYTAGKTAQLPFGEVDLGRGDYVTSLLGATLGGSIYFGLTGTPSSMTMSGNTVTIVFGAYNSTLLLGGSHNTAAGTGTMTWSPEAVPYDRAANVMSTAAVSESGAADKEF